MQSSREDRRATLVVGVAIAALAMALTIIAWTGLTAFVANLAQRQTVEVRTGAAAALVAAIQLCILLAVLFIGRKSGSTRLFRITLWLSPLLVLLPLTFLVATNIVLPMHGYLRCDPVDGQRYLTALWVPADAACPRSGAG